jgi:hypothetical protein
MNENLPLAERLKRQRAEENASLVSLTREQLSDLRSGLNDILREELNTILSDMKTQTEVLAAEYAESRKKLLWQLVTGRMLIPWLSALMLLGTIFLCGWGVTQYYAHQIPELRRQASEMYIQVRTLEQQGGRMKMNQCDGRLCVQIDPNSAAYGDKGENYRIVKGY